MPKVRAILDFLIPVLEVVRDRTDTNYRLIAPGNYSNSLNKVLPKKLHRNMEVSGFVKDLIPEYLKSDVFVYFSYLDSVPNVILEAWASKLPVVVNRAAWSEEVVQHGKTGLLAETEADARKYIAQLLREKNMREDIAMQGYEYVKSHHTFEIAGKRLGKVFDNIVK